MTGMANPTNTVTSGVIHVTTGGRYHRAYADTARTKMPTAATDAIVGTFCTSSTERVTTLTLKPRPSDAAMSRALSVSLDTMRDASAARASARTTHTASACAPMTRSSSLDASEIATSFGNSPH